MRKVTLKQIPIIVFCLTVLVTACSKDGDGIAPCSAAWATDLQNELVSVSTAASTYQMDQSDANCQALKTAYQNYINALKPYGNCATLTGQSRTDWKNALDEAEASVATLCQ